MITEIVIEWLVRLILIVYVVGSAIFMALKKIRAKKKSGQKVSSLTVLQEIALRAVDSIKFYENAWSSVTKQGAKTGALKLKAVLTEIEKDCNINGIKFDNTYWTDFIDDIIAVKNAKVQSNGYEDIRGEKGLVGPTGEMVQNVNEFKYIGVEKNEG